MSAQEHHIATRSEDAFDAILIDLERYHVVRRDPRLSVTAPGHRLWGAVPVRRDADVWLQRR